MRCGAVRARGAALGRPAGERPRGFDGSHPTASTVEVTPLSHLRRTPPADGSSPPRRALLGEVSVPPAAATSASGAVGAGGDRARCRARGRSTWLSAPRRGRAARPRRSPRPPRRRAGPRPTADLGGDQQLVRPGVQRAHVDDRVDARARPEGGPDRRLLLGQRALADEQPDISKARKTAITTSSTPIAIEPRPSQRASPVTTAIVTPNSAKHQADQRADVLEQHHGQLGLAGVPDEPASRLRSPRDLLASRRAVRNDQDSSTIAMNSTA